METRPIPLYTDVDGTLIKTDLLVENVCAMIKREPWKAFFLPFWILRGKAHLKERVADHIEIDPSTLPYNTEFVEFLQSESEKGRQIYLASASEERIVRAIAVHLGFVRGILASALGQNLKGADKARAIRAHCGNKGFAYAGDNRVDLLVWKDATEGVLVNPSESVERSARNLTSVIRVFRMPKMGFVDYLKAARLHQWLKNFLVFVPLIVSHQWKNWGAVLDSAIMFLAFGFVASGTYIINDLLDLPSDRRHPSKKKRPIAAGQFPLVNAALIAVVLILLGGISATLVSTRATLILGTYLVVSVAYTLYIKLIVILDALTLAGLYILRVIGGAVAITVKPSVWLLAFSGFLFLSLGLLKRCRELDRLAQMNQPAAEGRDYRVSDDPLLKVMGVASGYIAVLVTALYIDSPVASTQYRSPEVLWLICPLLLYWVSRMWIKTSRREMNDDPLVYSAKDRTTWIVFALMALSWIAANYAI